MYETSVGKSLIIEISCDRHSVYNFNQAIIQPGFVFIDVLIYYLNLSDSSFLHNIIYKTK